MIVIPIVTIDGCAEPERALTSTEKASVIAQISDGDNFIYYQHGDTVPELPSPTVSPNWLGLEQDLVYSALFPKAIATADSKWFSVLQTTLQNGKRGEASENFLLLALSNLGVSWTAEEKTQLNQFLSDNNFTIQIQ